MIDVGVWVATNLGKYGKTRAPGEQFRDHRLCRMYYPYIPEMLNTLIDMEVFYINLRCYIR